MVAKSSRENKGRQAQEMTERDRGDHRTWWQNAKEKTKGDRRDHRTWR